MKGRRDWFIRVPWGKLALVGHGHPDGEPVFLVHGRQDSSSVFEPLIEQITGQYCFVALDMPGNGLSDPFPPGPKLMRFHFLAAMELAVKHLGWDKFIFVGHSMGCEQGLFYSVIHPGQITKMILLDAGPTLMRMQVQDHLEYQRFYDEYYENYKRENFERKPYSRKMAIQALQRHRRLTGDQCEVIMSRNYHRFPFYHKNNSNEKRNEDLGQNANAIGIQNTNDQNAEEAPNANERQNADKGQNTNATKTQNAEQEPSANKAPNPDAPGDLSEFIQHMRDDDPVGYFSWDNRLKSLAPQNYGNDYYFELFKRIPPTLLIAASDGAKNVPPNPKWRQGAKELLDRMATLDNFHRVDVEGSHDVHFTHPERVVPYINAFLQDNKVSSKL